MCGGANLVERERVTGWREREIPPFSFPSSFWLFAWRSAVYGASANAVNCKGCRRITQRHATNQSLCAVKWIRLNGSFIPRRNWRQQH
jgi:hypothetical protein